MKKYGIFYGSATGTTARIAEKMGAKLELAAENIHDVRTVSPEKFGDYDVLLLGTSTWGDGELEEDWYDVLAALQVMSLAGKKIALFGCGDESMTDTFCNGVGELYKRLKDSGAEIIGSFDTEGYDFSYSEAVHDGVAVGLLLDEVNKPEMTDARIEKWVEKIKGAAE